MKLDKSQALLLSKIVFTYAHMYPDMFSENAQKLLNELNAFLVDDDSLEDDEDDEEEDESENDESESGEDDEDEEDEEFDPPEHTAEIEAAVLHNLSPVEVEDFSLEFEVVEVRGHQSVDVLLSGDVEHSDVQYIQRTSKTVEFWENGAWTQYPVKKFSKDWKNALKLSIVYLVK